MSLFEQLKNNIETYRREFNVSAEHFLIQYEDIWVKYLDESTKRGQTFFQKADFPGYPSDTKNLEVIGVYYSALHEFFRKHGIPEFIGQTYIEIRG
jgi:hypothetical protein